MKAPLAIRFDKDEVEAKCQRLVEGTELTKADIGRAAMNIGLRELGDSKEMFNDNFSDTVLSWQDGDR